MTKSADHEFRDFVETLQERIKYDINVSIQAKIKKYDEGKNTADVTTIIKDKKGIDDTVTILECPVLVSALIQFSPATGLPIYSPLKTGEGVMLLIDNRNLDNFTPNSGPYKKDNERMHSINDAVVIGRYKKVKS